MITVRLPFTIEFDIVRNTLSSANLAQIRIYNLSEKNRNQLRRNVTNWQLPFQAVLLKAGYGDNLSTIFYGNITQAWSLREGVNFITQIECFDGGFAFVNGVTAMTFPTETTKKNVISSLINTLPHVTRGAVGDYPGSLSRANTYNGNTCEILQDLTGNGFFIDSGKGNALNTNEYISDIGGIPIINAKSGLLGTPLLEQTLVRFDMIFEPSLHVGQSVLLDSITGKNFNGQYKVMAVKHRGMISESVCGEAITTGEFFYSELLTPVPING